LLDFYLFVFVFYFFLFFQKAFSSHTLLGQIKSADFFGSSKATALLGHYS
jgi:hypothetical protein